MATIHMILQSKGGAGKSLVSSFWMQFLGQMGYPVMGIDTDPSNRSFAGFADLDVSTLEIMGANDEIDSRRFDVLVETVCSLSPADHVVIDTGASCFTSLFGYLKNANPFEVIQEVGNQVYIHTPVGGGGDLVHTSNCLTDLVGSFPAIPFVMWLNRYNGELVLDKMPFEEFKVYPEIKKHCVAEVKIPLKNPATFGKDIELLMTKRQTFREAINSSMPIMVRQRLRLFWNEACEAMKPALVFGPPRQQASGEG